MSRGNGRKPPEEKNAISHRARAVAALREALELAPENQLVLRDVAYLWTAIGLLPVALLADGPSLDGHPATLRGGVCLWYAALSCDLIRVVNFSRCGTYLEWYVPGCFHPTRFDVDAPRVFSLC